MSVITRQRSDWLRTGRPGRVGVWTLALTAAAGGAVAVQTWHLPTVITWTAYLTLIAAAAVVVGAGPRGLGEQAKAAAWLLCAGLLVAGLIRAAFVGRLGSGALAVAEVGAVCALAVYGAAAARQLRRLARAGR